MAHPLPVCLQPGKYALMGAAANLGGVVRSIRLLTTTAVLQPLLLLLK